MAGKPEAPGIAARATAAHEIEIEARLRALTPAEKVGQLLMIGVDGAELTPETAAAIHRIRPGGVILFRKNVRTAAQVAALTNALQRESLAAGGLPLLIATDQEGGTVSQVAVITEFPDPMALAAAGSERLVERVARANGEELRALGISVNLAPVLDVNSNPRNPVIGIRSFGNTPESVARFGRAYIRGLHAAGVIAVAKHFPGHGATDTDTHFDAVRVDASEATLAQTDLVPFQAAVREGVDMIMPAHLTVPALSGSDTGPVTFSRSALTTFLRARMGFRGVVITDSLQMAAALQGPFAESCVSAVRAGADILLLPGNLPGPDPRRPPDAAGATRIETAYQALLASLTSGRADALQPGEVDAAVRRILLVKKGLHASFAVTDWTVDEAAVPDKVRTAAAQQLAREAAAAGLAWLARPAADVERRVQSGARLLVLSPVVVPGTDEIAAEPARDRFGETLASFRAGADTVVIPLPFTRGRRPTPEVEPATLARVRAEATRADAIVVGIGRAEHLGVLPAARDAARRDVPIVVVHFGSPYLAAEVRGPVAGILATFSAQRDAFVVAAEALAGRLAVTGRPPVVVELDRRGTP